MKVSRFVGAWLLVLAGAHDARACDEFKPLTPEARQMMAVLEDSRAKPTERLFMLAELACLKDPAIRRQALETGLKSPERSLRAKALSEILMQRSDIRVQVAPIEWRRGYAVQWVEREGWQVRFSFYNRSREKNCINLVQGRDPCFDRAVLVIDGLRVRINQAGRTLSADFALDARGVLTGSITFRGNNPAKAQIDLL
jgi:hypothetical protein